MTLGQEAELDRDKFALLVMILTQMHMQQPLLHNRHLYQPVQPVMTHNHDTDTWNNMLNIWVPAVEYLIGCPHNRRKIK